MIKRIGKFLLVISSIKKRPLCEERLLFCYKVSAFLPDYGFSKIDLTLLIRLVYLCCLEVQGCCIDDRFN